MIGSDLYGSRPRLAVICMGWSLAVICMGGGSDLYRDVSIQPIVRQGGSGRGTDLYGRVAVICMGAHHRDRSVPARPSRAVNCTVQRSARYGIMVGCSLKVSIEVRVMSLKIQSSEKDFLRLAAPAWN